MNRYIRTKDGEVLKVFCENVSLFEKNDSITYYGENTKEGDFMSSLYLPKDDIEKQADTIEELCDRFVARKGNEHIVLSGLNYRQFKDYIDDNCEIYGSAWVGNDLKAVAKLNEKGELELL